MRATKMIQGLEDKSYYDGLRALNLTTLETKRNRRDLMKTFKILRGYDGLAEDFFF